MASGDHRSPDADGVDGLVDDDRKGSQPQSLIVAGVDVADSSTALILAPAAEFVLCRCSDAIDCGTASRQGDVIAALIHAASLRTQFFDGHGRSAAASASSADMATSLSWVG